jgi:hypothetical protein
MVLEDLATPEVRQMLQTRVGGVPVTRLTQEARATLEPLTHGTKPIP